MITREQIEKTTAEWETQNPTLAADVIGIEVMTTGYLRFKRGNGSSAWSALPYLDKIPPSVGAVVDLESATGILPVSKGGTGRETLMVGAFLRGNGDSIALATPETALNAMNGQKAMSFATAMSTVAGVVGGKDISLATFAEGDPNSVFSNSRYSTSYGYGIKCAAAGKYLVSATLNLQNDSATASTTTAAIRKVVGGTSTYIAKVNHTFADDTSGFSVAMTITPQVFTFEANTYLSLYNALSTTSTKADGCWLTAVYLGE